MPLKTVTVPGFFGVAQFADLETRRSILHMFSVITVLSQVKVMLNVFRKRRVFPGEVLSFQAEKDYRKFQINDCLKHQE